MSFMKFAAQPKPQGKRIPEILSRLKIHDVDTHVTEPADLWTKRMPKKWGDRIPHMAVDPQTGQERWYVNAKPGPKGFGLTDIAPEDVLGGKDPEARLKWMDKNGIYSQILFPNIVAFFPMAMMEGELEWSIDCVRAYNEFQADFCSVDPKRLIPTANLPFWDIDASVEELKRCYDAGAKSVNFGSEFEKIGLPRMRDKHWAPVLNLAQEMDLAVNFHIGFNNEGPDLEKVRAMTSLDQAGWAAMFFCSNIDCVSELIMGRMCHDYPKLRFVSVESGVGWLPFLVDALDWQFLNNNLYREFPDMMLPSEYFRRQIYGTFWFETDIAHYAEMFPDNIMFESDYPHMTSLTPGDNYPYVDGPRETLIANLPEDMPEDLIVKLLQDNAAKVFNLN